MCITALRRVRATIVAVEDDNYYIIWVCVCSLRYPACNARPSYCHLWSVQLCNIFSILSHRKQDFRKRKYIKHKTCVLIFSGSVWNISHAKKKWTRYDQECVLVFMYSARYYCPILMKLEFYRNIFFWKMLKYQISS